MKCFRGHHGTSHAILFQRRLDLADGFFLTFLAQIIGSNHVRIMSTPMPNADFAIRFNHFLKGDWRPCGGMKQRLPFIRPCPLRARQKILTAGIW